MPLIASGTELGRYTILGKLATGGMSEIYLAKQSGPSGFSKVLVLKIILPHLADDPSFMRMFFNEAKLAALLNHPSIVQIFDFGEVAGQHFIAMEHIEGQTLRGINRRLKREGKLLPRHIAARIIADTCSALNYAHGLCDPAGNHLRIIHRDVSLENIIVTYSGQVKLVDFGIAKATILESYTTQGTLKGKYNYMAPELIRGEEPDHRLDVFAVGVVMYAALLGRLPFKAQNHAQILDSILKKHPPAPREVDPDLPSELEAMTLKALHKDRDKRYQQLGELHADLESYLVQSSTVVMPFHLAQFMEATFPPGTDENRETYRQILGSSTYTPSTPGSSPYTPSPPGSTKPGRPELEPVAEACEQAPEDAPATARPTADLLDLKATLPYGSPAPTDGEEAVPCGSPAPTDGEEAVPYGFATAPPTEEKETLPYRSPSPIENDRPTMPYIADTYEEEDTHATPPPPHVVTPEPPPSPPDVESPDVVVPPPEAETREYLPPCAPPAAVPSVDDGLEEMLRQAWPLILAVAAGVCVLVAVGIFFWVSTSEEEQPEEEVATATAVDGPAPRPTPDQGPDTRSQARGPDRRVRRPARPASPATRPATRPASPASSPVSAPPTPETLAKLSVDAPVPGMVFLDGKPLGQLPVTDRPIPPGPHRVTIRNRHLGYSLTRRVNAKAGRQLELNLTPRKGTLRILVRPWAKVTVDGKALGVTPLAPLSLYEGPHQVMLENADLRARKRLTVTVRPGKTKVVKVHMDR
jgi:serine/threonine-protein kinase